MRTRIENEIFAKLNEKYTVDVNHEQDVTLISVENNGAGMYVTVDSKLLTVNYTPNKEDDFEEILVRKLELVDTTTLCVRISNLLG